jgi:flagellar hook-associated protein 1 FlgK
VNPELDDPNKIAASETGDTGDASNANKIVDFSDAEYFQNDGLKMNVTDFYTLLDNWIGTAGQEAESFTSNQSVLVQQVQDNKQSLSTVSLDEEMTNMLKFQHAYSASAQVMNIIDGMMDNIINQMGR